MAVRAGKTVNVGARQRRAASMAALALVPVLMLTGCSSEGGSVAAGDAGAGQAAASEGAQTVAADGAARTATDQVSEAASASAPAAVSDVETHGNLGAFSATTLQREEFTQDAIAANDVTVINFWSTTCPPCINEMPSIAAFAQKLPDNVQVVTLCFDGLSNNERAQEIAERAGYSGIVLMGCDGGLLELANQVRYTPTTVFVASDGTVVGDVLVGAPSDLEAAYLAGVNAALAWQGKAAVSLGGAA